MNEKLTPLPTPDADDLAHLAQYDKPARVRALVEREILRRTIAALLAAGYQLRLYDGGDWATPITTDAGLLLKESASTDEDTLVAYSDGRKRVGTVHFIYGNTGWDVIADHSVSLEEALKPVNDYAGKMSEWF